MTSMIKFTEDEYNIAVANEAYQDYVDSGYKTTPVAEFWRELDGKVEETQIMQNET